MKKGRHYNRQEIELISQSAIGKSINEIAEEEVISIEDNDANKGGLGQLVEKYLFGMDSNGSSEPDFIDAGIELKVTPYKKLKDGRLSAKERLVLNIIDYETEYKNTFKSSHFWFKNNTIQLLWYLYEDNKDKKDLKITHERLLELAHSQDLKQIEEDWNYIINKIRAGKAHELSEADTMYLGACTKGANSNSLRKQPFNKTDAMQRAFCFKTSYMTQLVRKYIGNYSDVEKVLKNSDNTFNSFINNIINKYKGKSQNELIKEFNIDSNSKSINNMIISRMFNITGRLSDTEEFQKANIIPRTVRIEEDGKIKESFPFPAFKFTDIINEEWNTCKLKEELETTKYMFFVFKKENNEYIFKGIKLWNMPQLDIDTSVMEMWINTYNVIKSGNIIKSIDSNGIRKTNFPGMSDNKVCHVRPHARDSKDTYPLPVKDKLTNVSEYTKHCFWLNNSYIEEILEEYR